MGLAVAALGSRAAFGFVFACVVKTVPMGRGDQVWATGGRATLHLSYLPPRLPLPLLAPHPGTHRGGQGQGRGGICNDSLKSDYLCL